MAMQACKWAADSDWGRIGAGIEGPGDSEPVEMREIIRLSMALVSSQACNPAVAAAPSQVS